MQTEILVSSKQLCTALFFLAHADELSITYILVLGDEVFLAVGDELLLRGAVGISERLGVSRLLAGLTIVGFGSSRPELVTSKKAALDGSSGIAKANVVGSNIAAQLLGAADFCSTSDGRMVFSNSTG